ISGGGLTSVSTTAVNVSPAAAAQLVVIAQPPAGVVAGSAFGLTVAAVDRFGNWVPGWNGVASAALASNPAGGTLSGVPYASAVQGVATFSGLTITTAGAGYTLQLGSLGLTPATTAALTVVPGAPVRMVVSSPQPASVVVGAGFSVTVTIQDWFGNTATSYNGRVAVLLAPHAGKGRLGGTIITTATGGVATFSNLKVSATGWNDRLIVWANGLPAAVTTPFNVINAPKVLIRTRPVRAVISRGPTSMTRRR
ncbi:MAG: hypothetical protein ACP5XB_08735, partial [Isosphaeraceae bacterium]